MFNKKKRKIEELRTVLDYKEKIINKQINKINELETIKNKFELIIDKQAKQIFELESQLKKQENKCEEFKKNSRTPKKTSKTIKKA